ncbi:IS66 family transposase [Flavitalea flava]
MKANFLSSQVIELRQQESLPILESLCKWIHKAYIEMLPKSAIGKTFAYSIERWKQLMIYTPW